MTDRLVHRGWRRGGAATTALLLGGALLAACGSDDDGAGGDEDAIRFMTIGTLESPSYSRPEVRTAVEARVKAINDAGGVNGRKLEVEFCNDKLDPNDGAACARKAVKEDVVAVVGGPTFVGSTILPVLERAKIPWLAGKTISDIENQASNSYPIQATHAINAALGTLAAAEGDEIAIISADNPVMAEAAKWETKGAANRNSSAKVTTHQVATGTVDFVGVVSEATTGDPDAVIINVFPPDVPKVVRVLRQSGYTGKIAASRSLMGDPTIEALGDGANGVLIAHAMRFESETDVPGIKEFRDQMAAADPKAVLNDTALNAWTGVGMLASIAGDLDTVDGASIMAYLDDLKSPIELDGVVPAYGSSDAPEGLPRNRTFAAVTGEIVDGKVKPSGDWIYPLD